TAHMAKYGTTEEQMALVTVKNRKYGSKNPNAMFQKPVTAEEVLKSRPVSAPLKLFDCCANADGAACLIIASAEKAKKLTDRPVWVAGLGLVSKGHPVGATGASQLFALTKQLRGEAGSTQVDGAKIGLAQNIGGIGMYSAVTILKA